MLEILSERAVRMHRDYLNELLLRRSIFEKSYPNGVLNSYIKGKGLARGERESMRELDNEISAHKIFFNSFSNIKYQHSEIVKKQYGDISHLLNEVFRVCMASEGDFVYIVMQRGRVEVCACKAKCEPPAEPILAVDICEHVYFLDYGFEKEKFLCSLLPYLSLPKIDQFSKSC